MASQSWVSLINNATAQGTGAGAALSSAATATISPVTGAASGIVDVAVVNGAGQPLGWYAGLIIRVLARGYVTTTSTSGTLAFALNTSKAGTYTAITGAHATLNTGTGAVTGVPWVLEAAIRCTAIATSGNTVAAQGEMRFSPTPSTSQTINTASAGVNLFVPSASGETATAIDTTSPQGIALRCTQATSACTIQLTHWLVEALD